MRLQPAAVPHERPPAPSVRLAYLMMLASSLAFAAMSACSHAAGERCDWRIPALARAALVLLFTAALAKARRVPLTLVGTRILWIRSITGSISMLLTFYALTHLPVATAVTLTNTFPLWVTLLAWPVMRQRPTAGVLAALASGVAGVYLIEQPQGADSRLACTFALTAAFCTAVVMIGLHRLRHFDPLVIVVHFSAVATGIIGAFIVWTAWGHRDLELGPLADAETIALLIGIGLLGATGQILMTAAFRVAMPQRLSVIGLSQVLFAFGFDVLFWPAPDANDRRFQLLGMALVIAPVGWLLTRHGRGR